MCIYKKTPPDVQWGSTQEPTINIKGEQTEQCESVTCVRVVEMIETNI
jgi:hypothetical protein